MAEIFGRSIHLKNSERLPCVFHVSCKCSLNGHYTNRDLPLDYLLFEINKSFKNPFKRQCVLLLVQRVALIAIVYQSWRPLKRFEHIDHLIHSSPLRAVSSGRYLRFKFLSLRFYRFRCLSSLRRPIVIKSDDLVDGSGLWCPNLISVQIVFHMTMLSLTILTSFLF